MKIVVVEDEKSIRNGLCHMLPKLNPDYQVVGTASNGVEGLEVISRMRPELVIMDIQMPEMDGLTMLERLRGQGVQCKVVVLTAYSDFTYAKRAIELNIENYLLKPIRIPELQKTLENVEKTLEEERGTEYLKEWALSLEQIFRGCILAEFPIDEELNQITQEKYALNVKEPFAMLAVWLGDHYDHNVGTVEQLLESNISRAGDYRWMILRFSRYQMVGVILYQMKDRNMIRKRYEDMVGIVLERVLKFKIVCTWSECNGLKEMADAFNQMQEERMWSLSFLDGTLITPQLLASSEVMPIKYPLDMESLIRQALADADPASFERVVRYFIQSVRDGVHHPDDIREAAIRFCLNVLTLGRAGGRINVPVPTQSMVAQLTKAVTWEEIETVIVSLCQTANMPGEELEGYSPLVKRARAMIEEYYMQGITLEELAQKLYVSEEYLSSQFKKETGVSFRDTVKHYRIDKIKELLLRSSLKLNQIADMVGYSDPKYMSKVFKEEVGMLPAEYRKTGQ